MTQPEPEPAPDPLQGLELRALVGPTASGKSALALAVARAAGAEIVSLDSMQVYVGMDVGTAKVGAAIRSELPHHMLDLVPPSERYDVQRFLVDLRPVLSGIAERGARALFVGGTAFYLKALTHGLFDGPPVDHELRANLEAELEREGGEAMHRHLAERDPASAARLHVKDTRRVLRALEVERQTGRPLSDWQREWGWQGRGDVAGRPRRLVGVGHATGDLDERIAGRTRDMLAAGWVEEAERIRDGLGFGPTAIQALGYREVLRLSAGELGAEECAVEIALRTRQFARRQRTWYRKFPEIHWLEGEVESDLARLTGEALAVLGW